METAKKTIIENKFGFNEILKHINDMANGIDLNRYEDLETVSPSQLKKFS
jgi:hypothetical protein